MVATHSITLHFPLPSYLSPELVLEHLQTYEPIILAQPYVQRFNRRAVNLKEVLNDPFFTETGRKIEAFEAVERVVILPVPGLSSLLSKDVRLSPIFQSFDNGVRCRADAQAGVRVWSTYEIRQRDLGAEFERRGGAPVSPGAGDWELVESARVECSPLLKPFVAKSFEGAHRDLCQRVIDELVRRSPKGHAFPPDASSVATVAA